MTFPVQNLHEFVLNLLNDPSARSAFTEDPATALSEAGLQDITPQDVQEVVPLVLDYAPGLTDLQTTDITPAASAIQQLQAVTHAASSGDGAFSGAFSGSSPFGAFGLNGAATPEGAQFAGTFNGERFDASGWATFDSDGGGAAATADSPVGEFALSFEGGTESLTTAGGLTGEQRGENLDFLGDAKGGVAASTVAGYVSSGGNFTNTAFTNTVFGGTDSTASQKVTDTVANTTGVSVDPTAGEQLSRVTNSVGERVTGLTGVDPRDEQAGARADGSGTDTGNPANLPVEPSMEMPLEAGQKLTSELTGGLTEDLPADLPDLPVANPLTEQEDTALQGRSTAQAEAETQANAQSSGELQDAGLVSESPLGTVTDPANDALSSPSNNLGDLTFGG